MQIIRMKKKPELESLKFINENIKQGIINQSTTSSIINVQTTVAALNNSLFIFSPENKCRLRLHQIITSLPIVIFLDIVIITNMIFLVLETYDSLRSIHTYANYAFTAIYTLEFILKIIAYGFIIGKNTYLRDPWNWLDLLVVITGLISFIPPLDNNLMALRLFKFMRPLKAIPIFPSTRLFMNALFYSLADVFSVLLALLLIIIVFAVIGLTFWNDTIYNRCRSITPDANGFHAIINGYERILCGGEIDCPIDSKCINAFTFYPNVLSKDDIKAEMQYKEFNYGITNYDNVLQGIFVVFLTSTGEGWSKVMSLYMDSYNYYASFIYFIFCVIVNYYFMLNLTISVLIYNWEFHNHTQLIQQQLKAMNSNRHNKAIKIVWENFNVDALKNKYRRNYMQIKEQEIQKSDNTFRSIIRRLRSIKFFERVPRRTYYHHNCSIGYICYTIYNQPIVQYAFYITICINTLLLLLERYDSGEAEYITFEFINLILVLIYLVDLIFNIIANGIIDFAHDWLNVYDFFYCLIAVTDLILVAIVGRDFNDQTTIALIFRVLRLLRIIKLYSFHLHFKVIFQSVWDTIIHMGDYLYLFIIFIFTYALLGFALFNKSMIGEGLNFRDFQNSLLTVFAVIIGDHWERIYIEASYDQSNSKVGVIIYFISLIIFGHIALLNIFIACLIANFQRSKKLLEKNLIVLHYMRIINQSFYYHHLAHLRRMLLEKKDDIGITRIKQLNEFRYKMRDLKLIDEGYIHFINKNTINFDKKQMNPVNPKHYRVIEREFTFEKMCTLEQNNRRSMRDSMNKSTEVGLKFDQRLFYEFEDQDYFLDFKMKTYDNDFSGDSADIPNIRSLTMSGLKPRHQYLLSVDSLPMDYDENAQQIKTKYNKIKTNIFSKTKQPNPIKGAHQSSIQVIPKQIEDVDKKEEQFNNTVVINDSLSHEFDISLDGLNSVINRCYKDEANNDSNNNKNEDKEPNNPRYKTYNTIKQKNNLNTKDLFLQRIDSPDAKSEHFPRKNHSVYNPSKPILCYSQIFNGINNDSHLRKFPDVKIQNEKKIVQLSKWRKIWRYMKNSSLFIFHTNSKFRKIIRIIVRRKEFHIVIFFCIIANIITITLETIWLDPNSGGSLIIYSFNIIFLIIFCFEGLSKIISDDFIYKSKQEHDFNILMKKSVSKSIKRKRTIAAVEKEVMLINDKPYIHDLSNILDFFCIIVGIVDLCYSSTIFLSIRSLRVIRFIRPINTFAKNENLHLMIKCLAESLPSLANAFISSSIFFVIYSLLGVNLFKANLRYYCTKSLYTIEEECVLNNGNWLYNDENFGNFLFGFKSTFIIMTKENWSDIMLRAAHQLTNYWICLFYIIYLIIGHLFILNIFKAVIAQQFRFIKINKKKLIMLSDPEKDWMNLQKRMLKYHPRQEIINRHEFNNSCLPLKKLEEFVTSLFFAYLINFFVIASFIVLLIQYLEASQQYRNVLQYINYVFIIIFFIELILKIISFRKRYIFRIWTLVDSILIIISLVLAIITATNPLVYNLKSSIPLTFRIFRLFKMIRLLIKHSKIKGIMTILSKIFTNIAQIGLLFLMILLIYGNIGMSVFGAVPYRDSINHNINFRNFLAASILLFKVTIGENWTSMMNELAYHNCKLKGSAEYLNDYYCVHYNVLCYNEDITYEGLTKYEKYSCGNDFSYFYFISYIILCPILLMSLCITMTIEGFNDSMEETQGLLTEEYMKKFLRVWSEYDINCRKMIRPYEFVLLLKEVQPPIGLNYDRSSILTPSKLKRERERLLCLKRVNAFTQHFDKRHLSVFLSYNNNFFTTDLEVMKVVHKLNLSMIAIDCNKDSNDANKKVGEHKAPEESLLTKEQYIHFVDACIALSRFAISKNESVPFEDLRMDIVSPHTEKLWKKEFSADKEMVNKYYEVRNSSESKIGKYLASVFVFNQGLRGWLEKGRKRIAEKKRIELLNQANNKIDNDRNYDYLLSRNALADKEIKIPNNTIDELKDDEIGEISLGDKKSQGII